MVADLLAPLLAPAIVWAPDNKPPEKRSAAPARPALAPKPAQQSPVRSVLQTPARSVQKAPGRGPVPPPSVSIAQPLYRPNGAPNTNTGNSGGGTGKFMPNINTGNSGGGITGRVRQRGRNSTSHRHSNHPGLKQLQLGNAAAGSLSVVNWREAILNDIGPGSR
jgi:hypothetical protein